jgi:transcriptional regulator with GAF, ATPase, and Fis domain
MNPAIEEREKEWKATPRLRSLYEIAKALNSSLDLRETYGEILAILSRYMGMKRGGFLVLNAESNEWEMGEANGLSGEEMRRRREYFGSGIAKKILEKGQMAAVVERGESLWLFEGKAKTDLKRARASFFCAPLKDQGSIVAILGVDHFFEEPVSVAEDFNLLGEVCSLISESMQMRRAMAAENRGLLEENWSLRKELETLGQSVPKVRRRISLTEILEDRLSRMIAEMKVDPRTNGRLYDEVLTVVERTLLKSALEKTKHIQLKTARFLGINRNTLRRKIKELGITAEKNHKSKNRLT